MNLIVVIIIGFVAGALAKFLMPGNDPGGFIITTLLGIGGALVANFLGQMVGWYNPGETGGFIASVVGAVLILLVYRQLRGGRATT